MKVGDYWIEASQDEIEAFAADGSDLFCEFIKRKVMAHKNNRLISVYGDTGSGKSVACLKLAEKLDPDFINNVTPEGKLKQIIWDPVTFADMISEPEKHGLKRGSVLIVEESGVQVAARNFQSTTNKIITAIAATFRHLNLIVLFNVPDSKMLDINILRLVHNTIVMQGVNHGEGVSSGELWFDQTDHKEGKNYRVRGFVVNNTTTGEKVVYDTLKFYTPSKRIIDEYESTARAFKLNIAAEGKSKMLSNRAKIAKQEEKALMPSVGPVVSGRLSREDVLNGEDLLL